MCNQATKIVRSPVQEAALFRAAHTLFAPAGAHAGADPGLDAAGLEQPFQPFSADAQAELSFLSGVDQFGDAAAGSYWQFANSEPHKWGGATPGTGGGAITFSFVPGQGWLWDPADEARIAAGLALWSAIANIQFVEAPYTPGNPTQIQFFYQPDYQTATETESYPVGFTQAGAPYLATDIAAGTWFDPPQIGISGLASFTAYGGYGVDTIIHEEGHLLGLGHAGPYNGYVDPTTQQAGPYDSRQWSLMSYINPWDSSAQYYNDYPVSGTNWGLDANGYYRAPTTWMPMDILAAQRLYGLPGVTPLSGGQTFGFNCNVAGPIEPFFDFTINSAPVVTLWDAGADNTLDVSGFAAPAVIDLRAGAFSSVDGMTNNIGIAYGTAIDTALGGPGGSVFWLNLGNDSVSGGGGNQAVFSAPGNYADRPVGLARIVRSAAGAADTLAGVGGLAFVGGSSTVASYVGGQITMAGGNNELFLGGMPTEVTVGGADTVVTSSGFVAISAQGAPGARGDLVFATGGGGLDFQGGATRDTVLGAAATVTGGVGGIVAYGVGEMVAQGGIGYAVLASFGASSETVQSGAGGGLLVGGAGGDNRLTAGGGSTVIFGGGNGDLITLANAQPDAVAMGGGAETVDASAATASHVIYAGSGNDLVVGGAGGGFIAPGSGNDTISASGGVNGFLFIAGRTGGTDVITDWDPSRDYVFLIGYGAAADASAARSQTQYGGGTLLTLADHTQIWFLDTAAVAQTSLV